MDAKIDDLRTEFEQAGQGHVFAYWDDLGEDARERLLADAASIDLKEINRLVETFLKGTEEPQVSTEGLEPAPYTSHPDNGGEESVWAEAHQAGKEALQAGRVAAFTVAGGQGTRLGYDGPKGTFPVTPVSGTSLFEVFAGKLLAAMERYKTTIPWYIMTSTINHEATVAAFEDANFFGLDSRNVRFFSQGRMPAVDFDGKILLETKDCIAMSPDGHGGSLRALVRSGAVADMQSRGIDTVSYFQVDNPLVRVIDPAFIGFHLLHRSEMSSKMIPKAYPGEKVGHFCMQDGHMCVVEYSDMPEEMQEETDAQGRLRFIAGSIAIHILDVGFVQRIGGDTSDVQLPFHKAVKKIKSLDAEGKSVKPEEPNGVKFEMFVFDALPFAENPIVVETLREDDFSPVKNASGVDSAESSRADQLRQWTRWLRAAGVELNTDASGLPEISFEVSPLFADSEEAFVEKWAAMDPPPPITEGTILR